MIDTLKYYLYTMFEKGYAVAAVWLTIFRELFTRYIFKDWDFVGFLFALILFDTFFATLKVIRATGWRSLSFKEAEKFLVKIFLYFGVLSLSHILGNFTIHGKANDYSFFTWVDTFLYFYLITKEALSVARNINSNSPAYVPPFLIDRLNRFQKTGKLSDLTTDEEPKAPDEHSQKPNI
ncbi:MAG: phage holin family protein [Dyadobacter sp.]|uniref:phage holin family protein n=1 Tax=Dyadobacter sp. TaxID=1914288 RepID=UPI003266223B